MNVHNYFKENPLNLFHYNGLVVNRSFAMRHHGQNFFSYQFFSYQFFRNQFFRPLLFVITMFAMLTLAPSVQASPVTIENGTVTKFTAATGSLTFDWDTNSIYDITDQSVIMNDFDIVIPAAGLVGTIYEFIIPNFYDPLPVKKIEVVMMGANPTGSSFFQPSVTSVTGADSDYYAGGPAILVPGMRVGGSASATVVTENWEIYPNPDYETINIYVPDGFMLDNIMITTQSTVVPVPAAIWLMLSGMAGVAGMSWKRQSSKDRRQVNL